MKASANSSHAWARNRGPEGLKAYREQKNRAASMGFPEHLSLIAAELNHLIEGGRVKSSWLFCAFSLCIAAAIPVVAQAPAAVKV
jgi:hypothetical protein